ncbi:Outer membrane protein assembly factor BamB [Frondihabitans sp. 762G35]|uniref:outer membrane protein assembly factor BamB family protein n=1 Tax=Frondihabitans sp. 762G35 TaxID=1446794 RepID=UPI000D2199BE|nr:PQQ-binding-like beta-propeller repeat protein [Frondihabitans sp. 762G35]ARC57342.1 Outer membrane protein assembly factor BamB [Frondihabitans sp. 762G35]
MGRSTDDPWLPARPAGDRAAWDASSASGPRWPGTTVPPLSPIARDGAPSGSRPGERPSGRPGRGRFRRLRTGSRILAAYLALAAVVALVAGVGTALQPVYGSLSPWHGIAVDDVRSAPSTSRWAVDLTRTLAPGAPPECVRFTAVDAGQDLALVRADAAYAYGFSENPICSAVPAGFRSRIVLLDAATGAVRWVHDASSGFSAGQGVGIAWLSTFDHSTRVLVRAQSISLAVTQTLSLETGKVLSSTDPAPWSQEDRFTATGSVVAQGTLSEDRLTYTYTLRDADDLRRVVWSGEGNQEATLIALSDRLLLGTDGTEQIPLSTGRPSAWGPAIDTSLGVVVRDDVVYAADTSGSGVTTQARAGFTATDRTGRVLWRSGLALRGSSSSTRSCLAVSNAPGDRLSCLDYRTGRALWSAEVGQFALAGSASGQHSDDVYVLTARRDSRLVALDGLTGRERFQTPVPTGAALVAAGTSAGYAIAYGRSGAQSTAIALDLSSGSRLWQYDSTLQLGIWGGHLVDIGRDGLARRLDD